MADTAPSEPGYGVREVSGMTYVPFSLDEGQRNSLVARLTATASNDELAHNIFLPVMKQLGRGEYVQRFMFPGLREGKGKEIFTFPAFSAERGSEGDLPAVIGTLEVQLVKEYRPLEGTTAECMQNADGAVLRVGLTEVADLLVGGNGFVEGYGYDTLTQKKHKQGVLPETEAPFLYELILTSVAQGISMAEAVRKYLAGGRPFVVTAREPSIPGDTGRETIEGQGRTSGMNFIEDVTLYIGNPTVKNTEEAAAAFFVLMNALRRNPTYLTSAEGALSVAMAAHDQTTKHRARLLDKLATNLEEGVQNLYALADNVLRDFVHEDLREADVREADVSPYEGLKGKTLEKTCTGIYVPPEISTGDRPRRDTDRLSPVISPAGAPAGQGTGYQPTPASVGGAAPAPETGTGKVDERPAALPPDGAQRQGAGSASAEEDGEIPGLDLEEDPSEEP